MRVRFALAAALLAGGPGAARAEEPGWEKLFDVGPGAFSPPPRVWSAVARLTVRREPAFAVPPAFARTVSAAFSARRKTLRNALRSLVDVDAIVAAGIDPQLRPEVLSPAEFAKLAAQVPDDSSN